MVASYAALSILRGEYKGLIPLRIELLVNHFCLLDGFAKLDPGIRVTLPIWVQSQQTPCLNHLPKISVKAKLPCTVSLQDSSGRSTPALATVCRTLMWIARGWSCLFGGAYVDIEVGNLCCRLEVLVDSICVGIVLHDVIGLGKRALWVVPLIPRLWLAIIFCTIITDSKWLKLIPNVEDLLDTSILPVLHGQRQVSQNLLVGHYADSETPLLMVNGQSCMQVSYHLLPAWRKTEVDMQARNLLDQRNNMHFHKDWKHAFNSE